MDNCSDFNRIIFLNEINGLSSNSFNEKKLTQSYTNQIIWKLLKFLRTHIILVSILFLVRNNFKT
jgi:hypothetical protein